MSSRTRILFAALGVLSVPVLAQAYIGPGAGFALVSSFLTFIVAFFAAFFALFTLSLRLLIRTFKQAKIMGKAKAERAIILGLDGLDPDICRELMARGELPNFSRLAAQGSFLPLGTSVPAMSPVAWSSFATGTDASRHGIFDFLSRDPRSYLPVLSSSSVAGSGRFLRLGPVRIPLKKGRAKLLRKSKSFWKVLGDYGIFSTVLRVPITFPPEKFFGVMLAGMCVPDLRGTMGSFTYFTTSAADEKIGGKVVKWQDRGEELEGELEGPPSPFGEGSLKLTLTAVVDQGRGGAEIRVSGERFFLPARTYSPWKRLTFKAAPGVTLTGIARFYITNLDGDFGLYVSPIHIDPEKPAMPVSSPPYYSIYLAKKLGPFGTLGLAEDTWAMNEGILDEEAFLAQAYAFHRERKEMFFDALAKLRRGMVVCVFDLSDRLQHMFFRFLTPDHPSPSAKHLQKHRGALYDMYRHMDKLVGQTMAYVDQGTALFVISDHGFKPFKKGVDLNVWLLHQGYLALRPDAEGGEYLSDVDWSRTRAYAVGLGGVFINLEGRERRGIVKPTEAAALKEEISSGLARLVDEEDGVAVVARVYDVERDFDGPYRREGPDLIVGLRPGYRVSWDCARGKLGSSVLEDNVKNWSGDHCMDPEEVPGVFFSNLKPKTERVRLVDIAPTVLDLFGIEPPAYMVGRGVL